MQRLRPTARALDVEYIPGRLRTQIYDAIVEQILEAVRTGGRVCSVFYGHPGVFATPSHEAVRRARAEGFEARMLPAVSAEDCLFADLGVDPGRTGCQSYEATDFLVTNRVVETTAALILWQVSVIGEANAVSTPRQEGLRFLAERLAELYPADHLVTLYQASPYPVAEPIIRTVPLGGLAESELPALATLYVPPTAPAHADPSAERRLGL